MFNHRKKKRKKKEKEQSIYVFQLFVSSPGRQRDRKSRLPAKRSTQTAKMNKKPLERSRGRPWLGRHQSKLDSYTATTTQAGREVKTSTWLALARPSMPWAGGSSCRHVPCRRRRRCHASISRTTYGHQLMTRSPCMVRHGYPDRARRKWSFHFHPVALARIRARRVDDCQPAGGDARPGSHRPPSNMATFISNGLKCM